MKKYIINLAGFALFALVFYVLLIIVWGRFTPAFLKPNLNYRIGSYGHMFTRLNEVKNLDDSVNILFLGSSHSYRGFDPRNFQPKRSFNLGSSSQTPIQTQILLEKFLDKVQPGMVVYEVYPGTFEADGVESSLDLIANDKTSRRSLRMVLELNNIKTYNTFIYGCFADAFNLNKNFVEPVKRSGDTYIPGGYVERIIEYYKYDHLAKNNTWELHKNQLKKFEENIALIKKKNKKIVLVYAPITGSLYNSYTNNNYFDSLMKSYNLPYYNFNGLVQLDDSLDFSDKHHLNQNGVNKFNAALKEILK